MATMPSQYYARDESSKNYDQHLFIAGRGLQSAELNEMQIGAARRLRGIADSLFKDGDIVRDAGAIVDEITGLTRCQSGALYILGVVRGVPPASFTIPVVGPVAVGVWLLESVVTSVEDPTLLDPATGTRNYNERGAERLEVNVTWGWDGDGSPGEFFPVYSVVDGVMSVKELPPNLDSITQALARYDRDSAGGIYIVSGLALSKLDDALGVQYYSLSAGRARVFGYGVELQTSRRISHAATPDLKAIANEPHLSSTTGAQRINFDRTPGTGITEVTITAQATHVITHGAYAGVQDPLPDTSILSIVSVTQGGTTYVSGVDFNLTSGKVDWTLAGAEPAPGSTYNVTYRYFANVTPTAIDDDGFTVTGAVAGTLVLVTYSQKLPRYDRLCMNQNGGMVWFIGISADYNAQMPRIPPDLLSIATVHQTWTASRQVINDGAYMVPMTTLARVEGRMDYILQLVAQQALESNIHTREAGTKKGLFTDPFLDDSQRDAGTAQTAAIVRGELILPITATASQVSADISSGATLAFTSVSALNQPLRTGSMNINPYLAFTPFAEMSIFPNVDRWTTVQESWASAITRRLVIGNEELFGTVVENRNVLLSSSTSASQEMLREISIAYTITGFAPSEPVSWVFFDGISRPTGGVVANGSGVVSGTFTVPANVPSGTKLVEVLGGFGQRAVATFAGIGTIERQTWQQQTITTEVRQSPPPPQPLPGPTTWEEAQAFFDHGTSQWVFAANTGEAVLLASMETRPSCPVDPLAQTFTLTGNTPVSAIDLWFSAKSTTTTRVQIRGTATGFPTQEIIAEARIQPADINVGGASTRINFDHPVTLLGGVEYAIVVLCNDAVGAMSVAELGKFDSANSKWITSQPYTVGVLLSSSNAVTWTAHQDRDLAFRILRAAFSETTRAVSLGHVAVTGATDLLLMSYAERPSSATGVQYTLTLPDASVLTVDDGQPVQLAAAITGDVGISAHLSGSADFSPVLFPGSQLVAGVVQNTGTYVTRAIPAGAAVNIKTIFNAVIPSGATVVPYYKGVDVGDAWTALTLASATPVDNGFVEFVYQATGVTETAVQIKLELSGTPAARPRVADLRAVVLGSI